MNKPLCVISCPIDTYSGYGSRARDFVKALYELKQEEWTIKILSQRWGNTSWGFIKNEGEEWDFLNDMLIPGNQLSQQPDYWFQVTIPNEFQAIGKLASVGVTAGIETTLCDPSWIEGINRMSLTLVSSNHAKQVFTNSAFEEKDNQTGAIKRRIKLEKPIEVLFEGADLNKYFHIKDEELDSCPLVESLDDIEEDFNFLFVGHWLQGEMYQDRKNVSGTIKMFLEAFKGKKNKPGLILKTTKIGNTILDRDDILENINKIRQSVSSNGKDLPNIYFLHGELKDEDVNNLYNHPKVKAMIYFGHGEGYGRPLLEFTLSKKPIIASGWSGHIDFLSGEFCLLLPGSLENVHPSCVVNNIIIPESKWFKVDEKLAEESMINMYEKYNKFLDGAKRQSHRSKTEFSFDKMKETLNNIINKFPKPMALQLPKLKKVKAAESNL